MRGVIGRRLSNSNGYFNLTSIAKQTPFLIQPTSHFSSFSSSGRGRGRGSGDGTSHFGINREPEPLNQGRESSQSQSTSGFGRGRGRGTPIQSDSISPPFVKPESHSIGRGRGSVASDSVPPPQQQHQPPRFQPQQHQRFESEQKQRFQPQQQQPRFQPQQRFDPQQQQQRFDPQQQQHRFEPPQHRFEPPQQQQRFESPPQQQQHRFEPPQQQQQRFEPPQKQQQHFEPPQQRFEPPQQQRSQTQSQSQAPVFEKLQETKDHSSSSSQAPPNTIFNALVNEFTEPGSGLGRGKPMEPPQIRRPSPPPPRAQQPRNEASLKPQQAQAASPPRPQLSPEEAGRRARSELSKGGPVGGGRGGGRGRGGRGMRGGGRGGRGGRGDKKEEEAEKEAISVFVGDLADGEKFAEKIGPEKMSKLAQSFEQICEKAVPSPVHEAYIDALDTNFAIECEPEYLMPDFGSNPDIDEKPPMSLREYLEKTKPFMVAYQGIKDQEEWEKLIEEAMGKAPLMKKLVDHYSGPDRITAKKQGEELDKIVTALPKTAPDSVKRFADRAALSLKSNPGWGYDKKYQFMDRLVKEVSQIYK